ncbi:alpha/beta hydrolase [Caenispirillum salinarum AK4]|uniref:Alpha/beta hydrolase n=1 Tax=Caenispirillum salinarum AK4 TaxID=1238182 RepID=K9HEJ6_9PROT|nr:haloalkane dehalogenase [Caenispirillum salinarum]EKV28928.1 alpha/beta hydrolase [Caenispirillum salinarum AK4]
MRHLPLPVLAAATLAAALTLSTPAQAQEPGAEFPYEPRTVDVLDSTMAYVETGQGDPIVLLHGNPTWSYLWRNVIPYLEPHGRVIAVDLIGFGRSGQPDIAYTYADHRAYMDAFIDAMALEDITFVLHDWGSAIGLHYAARNPDNVAAVAFMEALVPPAYPIPSLEAMGDFGPVFRDLRTDGVGEKMVHDDHIFIEQILPGAVMRDLPAEVMDNYRAPFAPEDRTRKPILVFPRELPIAGEPADVVRELETYFSWMRETDMPFLHVYARPGALNPPPVAEWLAANLKTIETAFIGEGLHYIQEDQPEAIGRALADWLRRTRQGTGD